MTQYSKDSITEQGRQNGGVATPPPPPPLHLRKEMF